MIGILSLIVIVSLALCVISLFATMVAPVVSKNIGLEPVPAFMFSLFIIVMIVVVEEWIRH